jgi:hypothetical protein
MVGLYDGAPRVQNLINGSGVTSDTQYRHQVGVINVKPSNIIEVRSQPNSLAATIWDAVREYLQLNPIR